MGPNSKCKINLYLHACLILTACWQFCVVFLFHLCFNHDLSCVRAGVEFSTRAVILVLKMFQILGFCIRDIQPLLQTRWHASLPVFRKHRHEDPFEASPGYIVSSRPAQHGLHNETLFQRKRKKKIYSFKDLETGSLKSVFGRVHALQRP
jgi:hypothetical protein